MIFSATGRAALARVSVVVMRPCSNKLVTRLRSVARRCHGLRPSFDPDFKCRIFYSCLFDILCNRTFGSGKNPGADVHLDFTARRFLPRVEARSGWEAAAR